MSWQHTLAIPLLHRKPKPGELRTLACARAFALKLSPGYAARQHWQRAVALMLESAEGGGSIEVTTRQIKLALLLDGMLDLRTP